MKKYFNTEGPCYPDEHYMVNLDTRILKIKELVDNRKYFSINRGRQYGKTASAYVKNAGAVGYIEAFTYVLSGKRASLLAKQAQQTLP